MTVTDPLLAARRDAFARVRSAASGLRLAAQAAEEHRQLLERDVDSGAIAIGGDEYEQRTAAGADLGEQVEDRRADLAGALDELGGLEVLALAGRTPDEARATGAEASRRLSGELDPDDRLGWVAVGRAAELVAAGVDPSAFTWTPADLEPAEPAEPQTASGPFPGADTSVPGIEAFVPGPDEAVAAAPSRPTQPSGRRSRGRLRWPSVGELVTVAVITAVLVAGFAVLGGTSPGPVHPHAATPRSEPTGPSAIPAVDLTHQAEQCASLDSDSLGKLAPRGVSTGVALDPRLFVQRPYIGVGFAGTLGTFGGPDSRVPYEVIGTLYPPKVTDSPFGTPIDRAGSVQLWFGFDGVTSYKGLRRLIDGHWSMAIDAAADAMTVDAGPTSTLFFYGAIRPGWRFSMVVASAAGCKVLSSSSSGGPGPVSSRA